MMFGVKTYLWFVFVMTVFLVVADGGFALLSKIYTGGKTFKFHHITITKFLSQKNITFIMIDLKPFNDNPVPAGE